MSLPSVLNKVVTLKVYTTSTLTKGESFSTLIMDLKINKNLSYRQEWAIGILIGEVFLIMERRPFGYWKEKQHVINELKPLIEKLGYIPSYSEMKRVGYSGVARGIYRYHSMENVYTWFGRKYDSKDIKPYGYWKNKQNVIKFFENIIEQEGCIPSVKRMKELGYNEFGSIRPHYKLCEIRKWFNRENENKISRSIYNNKDLIFKEILELIEEFKRIPTIADLKNHGRGYLVSVIYKTLKKTYSEILDEMGFKTNKKKNGYWRNINNILYEANQIINEFGYLPSQRKLQNKYGAFCVAVTHYYGGFYKLRNDLGVKNLKRKEGYWQKEEVVLLALEDIIQKYGYIPKYLKKLGYGHLESGLQKHHGGIYAFALKHDFPLENTRVPHSFYENEGNIDKKLNELINEFGSFPSEKELLFRGEWAIKNRLCNKYGSIVKAKLAYGYNDGIIQAKDGHFCDSFSEKIVDDYLFGCSIAHKRGVKLTFADVKAVPDFIVSNNVIIEVLYCDYRLPPINKIEEKYIARYLKKRNAYLENNIILVEVFPNDLKSTGALGEKLYPILRDYSQTKNLSIVPLNKAGRHSPGYWCSINNIKSNLLPICQELGRMPTNKELKERGLGGIVNAAKRYHGGMDSLAEKLSFNRKYHTRGFWRVFENIEKILIPICEKLGRMPTCKEMNNFRISSMYYAITKYHGGLNSVTQRQGFNPIKY